MTAQSIFAGFSEWFFLIYFIGLNGGYLVLNLLSLLTISRYLQGSELEKLPQAQSGLEPPVSLLVPAYNESAGISQSIHSLLQLDYPEFEIIAINDGSKDETLQTLIRDFGLVPFPEAYRERLKTKRVQTIYHSREYPNLRVIDKENGGKADALNVGINAARYPIFCSVDADSILQRDSLRRVVRPFSDNVDTVACGGTVRIANGCEVRDGFLSRIALPNHPLALIQIVEYLRAFLFGRMGWSPLNALLIISGAFGLFRKEAVIEAGGYRTDTVGEDMELVVRLHRTRRAAGKPCIISFVPDPICWTEAPQDLRTLKNQRVRWQRGLCESLSLNMDLLFARNSGAAGWLAFPFMLVFEWIGPAVEAIGYGLILVAYLFDFISGSAMLAFLLLAISLGLLLSVSALLLEELSFHMYSRPSDLLRLVAALIVENLGYRQLNTAWRLMGLWRWILRSKGHWGEMKRKGLSGKQA